LGPGEEEKMVIVIGRGVLVVVLVLVLVFGSLMVTWPVSCRIEAPSASDWGRDVVVVISDATSSIRIGLRGDDRCTMVTVCTSSETPVMGGLDVVFVAGAVRKHQHCQ
jgi:hypothetical protein